MTTQTGSEGCKGRRTRFISIYIILPSLAYYVVYSVHHAQVDRDNDDYNDGSKTPYESEEEDEVADPHPLFPSSVCLIEYDAIHFITYLYVQGSLTWHVLFNSTSTRTALQRWASKETSCSSVAYQHPCIEPSFTYPSLIFTNPWQH